ncbi:MAG: alpha-glucan family phosphorylase [Nitrospirota bacterium]|nr:alpha-glucan family phosphorylase [Nitrospirota bacterium]
MQQKIEVRPALPERIARLEELSRNLWFSWNADARSLFFRLDRSLWRRVGHNPIVFLRAISQKKLNAAAKDRTYLEHYNRVMAGFDVYKSDQHTWYAEECGEESRGTIAYFSAEFGIHESLPIFSGGLGVLAGDHLKSASDMGLPLVAVGLLYRKGYFIQHIDSMGRQHDLYEDHDFGEMPVREVPNGDGHPLVVPVEMADRTVHVKVWEASIGRNPLYLLDTDIPQNSFSDRLITHQLYGGDMEMRICQEIVLGMGGVRALEAMGVRPSVWHMNEGHSVFLGLERIRTLVQKDGLSFYEALEVVRPTTVFTTHTPVAAGHDAFPLDLKDKYFKSYWESMGLSRTQFMALGLESVPQGHEVFSLTVLALNISGWCNGVSRLHGQVSSQMWENMWPGTPPEENPLTYVTNGVHTLSWLAPEMIDLFDQQLGEEWRANITDEAFWNRVDEIPDNLLWGVHQSLKRRMIGRIRERIEAQLVRNGEGAAELHDLENLLDPDTLTIGFARRFATYKRATLLFNDMERLTSILSDVDRPVQFVFAGKAHPADIPGQKFLQEIHQISKRWPFKGRVILVEGYDIAIARYLVSGVDVWLNTPRRPFEASGTSGMKAAMNGAINFSVLDGWWCEAAKDGVNGWSIGNERDSEDEELQAEQDARNLYQQLEEQIIPLYYQRNSNGVPEGWIQVAKASMKTVPPVFNTNRMVGEYARRFYFPAVTKGRFQERDGYTVARELAGWKHFVRTHWHEVAVRWESAPEGDAPGVVRFGEEIEVRAQVRLGNIPASDVVVEACVKDTWHEADEAEDFYIPLQPSGLEAEDGWLGFSGAFVPPDSGRYTMTVRVTPVHPELVQARELGLVCWLSDGHGGQGTHSKKSGRRKSTV